MSVAKARSLNEEFAAALAADQELPPPPRRVRERPPHLAGDGGRDFAHGVLDMLVDDINRPAFRAGFAASVFTAAVLARLGARALPAVVISAMTGAAVEHLYGLGEDAVDCLRDMRAVAAHEV